MSIAESESDIKTENLPPAAVSYKEIMAGKIVEGFEFVTLYEYELCGREAEIELAHLHPDNICGLGDWRLFRVENLPEGMADFDGVSRDDAWLSWPATVASGRCFAGKVVFIPLCSTTTAIAARDFIATVRLATCQISSRSALIGTLVAN
jgi:hypothetical protein